jgi:DNA-binding NtrC family response regulator
VTAKVRRALVVEDDDSLRSTLEKALAPWADELRSAASFEQARRELLAFRPDLVVLDFVLPDGTATELLTATRNEIPLPAVVALSAYAEPRDSFELAQLGVRAYLQKPIELAALDRAVSQALTAAPDVELTARGAVGRIGLREVEQVVRRGMLEEAVSRADGNRRGAARLLQVSREFLQHALRSLRR